VDRGAAELRATTPASFHLQIAMQSLAGGNFRAALSRLADCEALLLQELELGRGRGEGAAEGLAGCPLHEQQQGGSRGQQQAAGSAPPAQASPPVEQAAAAAVAAGCPFLRGGQQQAAGSSSTAAAASTTQPAVAAAAAVGSTSKRPAATAAAAAAAATAGCPFHRHHQQQISGPAPPPAPGATPPPAPAPLPAALACQLGAVCGSQADCHRRLGDLAAAAAGYRRSAALLQPHSRADPEVAHALSVTCNKRGDLLYTLGDLPAALACYQEALALRERLAAGLGLPPGAGGEQLAERGADLAASRIKVADALAALGRGAEARVGFEAARGVLAGVLAAQPEGAAAARAGGYAALVEAQLAQLGVGEAQGGGGGGACGAEAK
jgi:tetratricopeptide (TPR) repeat protein